MKRIALILFISALAINVNAQTDVTTFILVRHAEKSKDDPRDPSLSEEGIPIGNTTFKYVREEGE